MGANMIQRNYIKIDKNKWFFNTNCLVKNKKCGKLGLLVHCYLGTKPDFVNNAINTIDITLDEIYKALNIKPTNTATTKKIKDCLVKMYGSQQTVNDALKVKTRNRKFAIDYIMPNDNYTKIEQDTIKTILNADFVINKKANLLAVYLYICGCINTKTKYCYPSHANISKMTGISLRAVNDLINILCNDLGLLYMVNPKYYIEKGKRRRSCNFYTLNEPEYIKAVDDAYNKQVDINKKFGISYDDTNFDPFFNDFK